jgi:CheY-like chemotaxis protein
VAATRTDLAPGRYVQLSISDTGTGMDPETLKRAVEPFYSTKGIGKGTGLGLSMVHGLAAQLNGALDIHSHPGLGTRVDLLLPLSEKPAGAKFDLHRPLAIADHRGRALVVDDEATVRMTTSDMLEELGFATVQAASAREAEVLLLAGEEVDLVVTDHLMPGMTGAELARLVRSRWPELPVLLVSGYANADEVAPDLPRLAKPFRSSELEDAVKGLVRG